jgi:assimilatory nitrate reductase catalytic subunit
MVGVRLGETDAAAWLKEQMQTAPRPAGSHTPRARPVPRRPRPRQIVCNCFDVSETDIRAAVGRGADLPTLQRHHGTNCGSCVPEMRRLCAGRSSLSAAA